MKKIIALVILCLLLCAVSTTAFAATVKFFDDSFSTEPKRVDEVDAGTYELPEYIDIFDTLPDGKTFYGWQIFGKSGYLKPGSKITIKEDDEKKIYPHYIDTGTEYFDVEYVSEEYNENAITVYEPHLFDDIIDIQYPYQFGFGTAEENVNNFSYWIVEKGQFEVFDEDEYGPDLGWLLLFPRAFAAESVTLRPDGNGNDQIRVKGDLTIRAIWNDDTNPGGNDTNPGGNDTNPGGNDTNPGGNDGSGTASKAPKTGDESLPMGLLLVLMAASLCGIAVVMKRRIN